jgi:hypothetical protein
LLEVELRLDELLDNDGKVLEKLPGSPETDGEIVAGMLDMEFPAEIEVWEA